MDAINGVDKNTIYRESMKEVANAKDAFKSSSTILQTFSFNNVPGEKYSAAKNCKAVLERHGSEGVKSEGKRAKRESERGINKNFWHVRNLEDNQSDVRCKTIKDLSKKQKMDSPPALDIFGNRLLSSL